MTQYLIFITNGFASRFRMTVEASDGENTATIGITVTVLVSLLDMEAI